MSPLRSIITVATLVAAVAIHASAQAPDLMYLQFNEGSGTSTADTALPGGLSLNPTLTGLAGWDTVSPKLGAAALLLPSGAPAGDNCKTGAPFSLTSDWTLEFWYFGTETATTTRYIIGDASSTSPFRLYKTGATNMFFGATNFNGYTLENAYTPNVWTHIAISYDFTAKVLTVYKDGAFLESNTNTSTGILGITSASGLSIGGAGTTTQFTGAIDDFRLWGSVRSQAQIASNMNIELMSFSDDIAAESITVATTGTGCSPLGANEPVSCTVRNVGLNPIPAGTFLNANLIVDGGTPVAEAFLTTMTLNSGDSETFTFVATADLSALGAHTVDVSVAYAGDLNPLNDTVQTTAFSGGQGYVNSFPYLENFDGSLAQNSTVPPVGWTQDTTDGTGTNADWLMHYGATSSVNTGPHADTSGLATAGHYYAYVEDSSPNQAQVNLISPCLDLTATTAPILQFNMASYNGLPATYGDNMLSIDVISYPGGTISMDAFGPQGSLPGQAATWAANAPFEWQQQTLNLAPFAGQVIQLRFRGQSDQTPQYNDVAIDDVAVFEPVPTVGQAPRPGFAAFDINGALNPNAANVASGLGGPYFTTVTQGGAFDFHFEGEASQPIAVVYGALNPVAATYPGGIGQFDIGGPGVDPQGIPLNLGVFVNAIAWASAPVGFPYDSLFFVGASGSLDIAFNMPNFGIPGGTVLTTFQSAIASTAAPFVYLSNAIEVTVN